MEPLVQMKHRNIYDCNIILNMIVINFPSFYQYDASQLQSVLWLSLFWPKHTATGCDNNMLTAVHLTASERGVANDKDFLKVTYNTFNFIKCLENTSAGFYSSMNFLSTNRTDCWFIFLLEAYISIYFWCDLI